jgi:hypothetical protein
MYKRNPYVGNFDFDGIQNAYNYLFSEYGIQAPFSKTKGTTE